MTASSQTMRSGAGAFSEAVKNRFGNVWTDQRVVDLTVDEAFRHFAGDASRAEFIDPACGDGNFLVTVYRRLVGVGPEADPSERSLAALRRLYGVEIVGRMAGAARARLVYEHVRFLQSAGGLSEADVRAAADVVEANVVHGNTLRTAADRWTLAEYEGGECPPRFRAKRFDVIVGNPPYTSYKVGKDPCDSVEPPAAYADQNMAMSFFKWAMERVKPGGVVAYNCPQGVLTYVSKLRQRIAPHMVGVVDNELLRTYSKNGGKGNLPTVVLTLTASVPPRRFYNGRELTEDESKLLGKGAFLNAMRFAEHVVPFVHRPIAHYAASRLIEGRAAGVGPDAGRWNDFVYLDGGSDWHLGVIHMPTLSDKSKYVYWKLARIDDPAATHCGKRVGNGSGSTKWLRVPDPEHAKALSAFLNSRRSLATMSYYGKEMKSAAAWSTYAISQNTFVNCVVPDLEHYGDLRPAEYRAVLDFVEAHMASNDVRSYCAGVDAVVDAWLA